MFLEFLCSLSFASPLKLLDAHVMHISISFMLHAGRSMVHTYGLVTLS